MKGLCFLISSFFFLVWQMSWYAFAFKRPFLLIDVNIPFWSFIWMGLSVWWSPFVQYGFSCISRERKTCANAWATRKGCWEDCMTILHPFPLISFRIFNFFYQCCATYLFHLSLIYSLSFLSPHLSLLLLSVRSCRREGMERREALKVRSRWRVVEQRFSAGVERKWAIWARGPGVAPQHGQWAAPEGRSEWCLERKGSEALEGREQEGGTVHARLLHPQLVSEEARNQACGLRGGDPP